MSMPLWFLIFVLILYAKHDIQSLCDRYFRSLVSSSKRESEREKLEESTVSPARRSSFIFMKFSKKIQRQDEEESSIELHGQFRSAKNNFENRRVPFELINAISVFRGTVWTRCLERSNRSGGVLTRNRPISNDPYGATNTIGTRDSSKMFDTCNNFVLQSFLVNFDSRFKRFSFRQQPHFDRTAISQSLIASSTTSCLLVCLFSIVSFRFVSFCSRVISSRMFLSVIEYSRVNVSL